MEKFERMRDKMKKLTEKEYEAPAMKVYNFGNNRVLTASNSGGNNEPEDLLPNYAANALNDLMGGTNTTIE